MATLRPFELVSIAVARDALDRQAVGSKRFSRATTRRSTTAAT